MKRFCAFVMILLLLYLTACGQSPTWQEQYLPNGTLCRYEISEYDDAGQITKETEYEPDGTIESYVLYE